MHVTKTVVEREAGWVESQAETVVDLINEVRDALGDAFDVDVGTVTSEEYEQAVAEVFADGDRAVNVATLVALLRDLDVDEDYPGFVVDELLGRELASTIAGPQPRSLLAEATFHYADVHTGNREDTAGSDDLRAALAAGFQTRLPGWEWTATESPFSIE